MMIGEFHRAHPTIQIPPEWDPFDAPTAEINSPFSINSPDYSPFTAPDPFCSLQRYLPSIEPDSFDDAVSCDEFRMYDFKVRRCAQGRSHDWTECPFAHPGEKARRRDPRKYSYSGTACPEFRKGSCRKGDSCEFAHGVFECWLHPDRYRTQACKDGTGCRRRICFFAHSPEQLRVMNLHSPRKNLMNSNSNSAESYDGSPLRRSFDSYLCNNTSSLDSHGYMSNGTSSFDSYGYMSNNTSSFDMCNNASSFGSSSPPGSPTSSSPPMSPLMSSPYGSVNELVSNMRNLQLAKALLSPRGSNLRPGFCSLPTTPTRIPARFEQWDRNNRGCEEEPVMERVESGRDLRTKLYARLSKENSFGPVNDDDGSHVDVDPDLGWISDLVQ